MCASTPASWSRSANHPQPNVASNATGIGVGLGATSPKTRRISIPSVITARLASTSPASFTTATCVLLR
jgi:hypothetical protein